MNANNYTLKCPECNELVARDPRGLATHRRFKHGVQGASKSASDYRKMKMRKEKNQPAPKKRGRPRGGRGGELRCPECGDRYTSLETLGRHRYKFHNVPVNVKLLRRELAKTTQNAIQISHTNGQQPTAPAQDDGDHRIQAAATFASGRVAQLLESIALQHDIPYKPFARIVLQTVAHTAQVR